MFDEFEQGLEQGHDFAALEDDDADTLEGADEGGDELEDESLDDDEDAEEGM